MNNDLNDRIVLVFIVFILPFLSICFCVTIQVSEKPVQLKIIKKIPGEDRSFSSPPTILFHRSGTLSFTKTTQ